MCVLFLTVPLAPAIHNVISIMAQNTEDVTPAETAKYAQQASTDHFMLI